MVEGYSNVDNVLKAISDPVRRQILAQLKSGPATISDIADPHDMSFAGAAKHVKILAQANLIRKQKSGRQQICSLNAEPLQELKIWLESYAEFWTDRLDALSLAIREYEDER